MMKLSFFKIFSVFSVVGNWSMKALADGVVTAKEAAELAESICGILGVKAQVKLWKENSGPFAESNVSVGTTD